MRTQLSTFVTFNQPDTGTPDDARQGPTTIIVRSFDDASSPVLFSWIRLRYYQRTLMWDNICIILPRQVNDRVLVQQCCIPLTVSLVPLLFLTTIDVVISVFGSQQHIH
jgi:hypothetical protein